MAEVGPHLLSCPSITEDVSGDDDDPLYVEASARWERSLRRPAPLQQTSTRFRSLPDSLFDLTPKVVRSKHRRCRSTLDSPISKSELITFDGEEQDMNNLTEGVKDTSVGDTLLRISESAESKTDEMQKTIAHCTQRKVRPQEKGGEDSSITCLDSLNGNPGDAGWFEGELEDSGVPSLVACSFDSGEHELDVHLSFQGLSLVRETTSNSDSPSSSSEDGPFLLGSNADSEDGPFLLGSNVDESQLSDEEDGVDLLRSDADLQQTSTHSTLTSKAYWIGYNNTWGYFN